MLFVLHTNATLPQATTPEPKPQADPNALRLTIGHYGANYIHTAQDLKGRGIKLVTGGEHTGTAQKMYRVTDKALELLESKFEIGYTVNWD